MVCGPALEPGAREPGGHVDTVVVERLRSREDAHRADDGETDRDHGHDDGQPGGDPGEVERQPGATGHHQVPEHPLGEVERSCRAAQGGRNDEAEDVHHTGDKSRVDRVAAGRPVGLRVEGVSQQSHGEEEGGDADVHHDQGDHEPAPFAQLHELGCDHPPGGQRGSPMVTRGCEPGSAAGVGAGALRSGIVVTPVLPVDSSPARTTTQATLASPGAGRARSHLQRERGRSRR